MTMDYKKKIEIPFGAFDSELIRQEISIPNGFKATIEGDKIILTRIESEDERIRKRISQALHGDVLNFDEIIQADAWLEKQGEQKPFDYENANIQQKDFAPKVEPKFKVGDWVVNKGHSYLIADIDFLDNRYLFEIGGYTHEQLNWEYIENVDNKYHLWTIQDTKDGDVLVSRSPFIYGKQCPYGGLNWSNNNFIKASNFIFTDSPVHPATKEQRDLLFKKIKEAGYEWDAEKKELKKIDARNNITLDGDLMEADCMIVEQKPAWSEEEEEPNASDRGMAEGIIVNLKRVEQDYRIDLTKEIEWLRNKVKKGE